MKSRFLAGPYIAWMIIFTVVPLGMVVYFAFTSPDGGFTLDNFAHASEYLPTFLRSIWYALVACLICLAVGYPVAYVIAQSTASVQRVLYLLVTLPMCMSFLLRTLAWVALLRDTGIINTFFGFLGLGPFPLIRNAGAVILGMVYNYLPFMILPIYSVLVKLDHSLIEAARDLGASSVQVFRKVILPLSLPGVLSGITMVFVPSVSTFAISRLLGGGTQMMLGDLIEQQFLGGAYNPQLGAAIALVMMAIVVVCMLVMNRFGDGEEQAVML